MKTTAVFALLLASATAFNAPQFATRAVGKKAPVKAAPVKAAVAKKAAPMKAAVAKKAAPVKAAVAKKAAPVKAAVAKKAAPVKAAVAKMAPAKMAPAKKAPLKKTPVMKAAPIKKAVMKAAPIKKAVMKAAPVKKAVASKTSAPPESKGYPSFAASAQNFRLGKINGGGNKPIQPVFLHPTVNNAPVPNFDYKEAAKARLTKNQVFAYDDGLTVLERKQRATLPAFLTGSAKSAADPSSIRSDIVTEEFAFGLDSNRFQLLFISVFGLFTLVGCLSGAVSLD